jgi:hypothetical protein
MRLSEPFEITYLSKLRTARGFQPPQRCAGGVAVRSPSQKVEVQGRYQHDQPIRQVRIVNALRREELERKGLLLNGG